MNTKKTGGARVPASRAAVLALLDRGDAPAMRAVLIASALTHDQNLKHLAVQAGNVALLRENPRLPLVAIYGLCVGWLMNLDIKDARPRISAERDRQEELLAAGKFTFTCASPGIDPLRKLRVLVEEIGEVAQEIDQLEAATTPARLSTINSKLSTELVQVAAVAVAWLESLEPAFSIEQPATRRKP